MIFQARKTRLARIWTRFYGADKDFSHEKLGLVDFREIAEQEIRRGGSSNVNVRISRICNKTCKFLYF